LALLLAGTSACSDLEVPNESQADRERTLTTPQNLEALVSASYRTWWNGWFPTGTPTLFLSTASFQHSAYPANFVMVDYSAFPRPQLKNSASAGDQYAYFATAWFDNNSPIGAVAQALSAFDAVGPGAGGQPQTLGKPEHDARMKSFARLVQGLSHGHIALLFDKGYIFDETMDPKSDVPFSTYQQVMDAALGFLDQAIDIASNQAITGIPFQWAGYKSEADSIKSADLIRFAHSMKARFRANVARTPAEREAVDWDKVIADIDKGITADWNIFIHASNWSGSSSAMRYGHLKGWGQLNYHILGMADQSGMYQKWIATPITERTVEVDGKPALIVTKDKRFPQGETLADQSLAANRGTMWQIPSAVGEQWQRPDRGEWRWSYYNNRLQNWQTGNWPIIRVAELDLLKAEALYRKGDRAGAAQLVNKYRVPAGLNATDADGTNTSCVPKLANGTCGDLWEMLKWEKRLETYFTGPHQNSWYFDGRGWGDLAEGTFLHFPVPEGELFQMAQAPYVFGGVGGEGAAPKGVYGF
jgi:hypothetical protein